MRQAEDCPIADADDLAVLRAILAPLAPGTREESGRTGVKLFYGADGNEILRG
jgi:hypothetical protein